MRNVDAAVKWRVRTSPPFLGAVLQCFQQGLLIQQLFACQVSHGAGHPEDAVMGAGRKAQCVVGGAEEPLGGGGHPADTPHLPGCELGIAAHALVSGAA